MCMCPWPELASEPELKGDICGCEQHSDGAEKEGQNH